MKLRRSLLIWMVLFLLLVPMALWAGTVSRSTKPNGSTSWQDGDTITAAGLNGDADNIYNEFNGNIDNNNIKSSAGIIGSKLASGTITDTQVSSTAAIQPSKLDDHADSDANFREVTAPGRTGALVKPTTLEGDLENLRFTLKELKVGTSIDNDSLNWMDRPYRNTNLLYNGSFDATDGSGNDSSTSAPDGWALVATPTIAYAATEVGEGGGLEINLTANATNEGISQTLVSLKASRQYLALARAKQAAGTGSCELRTSGGDTDASVTTESSSYVTLADVFATDSTPTDVVLTVEADTSGDQCDFDHVSVHELNEDPLARSGIFVANDSDSSTTVLTGSPLTTVSVEVNVPGPGYVVDLTGSAIVGCGTNAGTTADLHDGTSVLRESHFSGGQTGGSIRHTHHLTHIDTTPTVGATTYSLRVTETAGTCSLDNPTAGVGAPSHYLWAKVYPAGG